ncbi:hypothetical protein L211DRAFT_854419 [Terfezia boudieri ATCC MYA-4762]|uniref:Uncharacterized protein n=1 Tax=Terfezia boudieri ATCC MYA-4762 TaxID=1051890 RepID=A0A3N4L6D5_9PEZI|nr:hypothetical protein L211DRAFT_854419 [Terfezia boudieri ATCC MYA-4762]
MQVWANHLGLAWLAYLEIVLALCRKPLDSFRASILPGLGTLKPYNPYCPTYTKTSGGLSVRKQELRRKKSVTVERTASFTIANIVLSHYSQGTLAACRNDLTNPFRTAGFSGGYQTSMFGAIGARIGAFTTGIATFATGIGTSATGIGASANGISPSATGIGASANGISPSATGIGASANGISPSATGIGASATGIGASTTGIGAITTSIGVSTTGIVFSTAIGVINT